MQCGLREQSGSNVAQKHVGLPQLVSDGAVQKGRHFGLIETGN